MKSNLIIQNLVLLSCHKSRQKATRDSCLSIWFDLSPLSVQLWQRERQGEGRGHRHKRQTNNVGAHLAWWSRFVPRRVKINRNWKSKPKPTKMKPKLWRKKNNKCKTTSNESRIDIEIQRKRDGRAQGGNGMGERGGPRSYQRKPFPSAKSCNAIAEFLLHFPSRFGPPLQPRLPPLIGMWNYAKNNRKWICLCLSASVGLAKQGSTVRSSLCPYVRLSVRLSLHVVVV